jgi:hypothetical protein
VRLTGLTVDTKADGKMVVNITGARSDTAADFSLTIPVS